LQELLSDKKLQRIHTMPPQILKPKRLWTGKQIISTLLKNIVLAGKTDKEVKRINKTCGMILEGKSRLKASEWGPLGKSEGEVIIRDNELLQGTLDSSQFGKAEQGMVHSFYECYGSIKAGELLTSLARVFLNFIQNNGFTVGLDDLVLNKECNLKRRMLIEKGHMNGMIEAAKFADMPKYNIQKLNYSNRVVF
jgi:DNA-directed RNA polymerase I subunit RPA1